MKVRTTLLSTSLILTLSSGYAQEKENTGKTLEKPTEFLSAAEYDKEAAIRISSFTLPDDVEASLFADSSQIQNPSAICFDHNGDLFVAEIHRWRAGVQDIRNEQQILLDDINNGSSQDRYEMYERDQLTRPLSFYTEYTDQIVLIKDSDGNGRADTSSVWATGFNEVLDGPGIGLIAGFENDIYYTNIPHLWRLTDSDEDGKAERRVSIQDGFGVRMSISGHDMHGLVWGPDGKLYWSIGDRGYSFTTKEGRHYHEPYRGGVFRCDPDGSNVEEIYTGLRNPQELAFDQYGNLFTCDNDADQWDKGRLVYILEGGDSGWNHGHQVLLNFRNQLELRTPDYEHPDHKSIPMNPWMTEAIWETQQEGRPAYALPPVDIVSWGPSGLVYNYGATAMPDRYAGHFWVCNFGGAKGDLEAFSVKEKGAGFAVDHQEIFMEGLGNTDVEFGPDGRMYLSCFNNNGWFKEDLGNIYTLASPEKLNSPAVKQTHEILLKDFSAFVETELVEAIGHPDMRIRQKAQFELVKRGAKEALNASAQPGGKQLKRLHSIWGLGQLARKEATLLTGIAEFLNDEDAEVRAQTVKVLADSRNTDMGTLLEPLLDDSSDRVKSFAAIGVGKCGNVPALPKLFEILAANNNQDRFLRHSVVQGMWYLNEREKILKEVKNESAGVRMGALLFLRKLKDPRVKYFLKDEDKSIAYEAIRAINDLNLITAIPDLAKEIIPFIEGNESARWPQDHRDFIIQTRIINANFHAGTPEAATRLIQYAAQTKLPAPLREQTLLALSEWKNPKPVDSTDGSYRPIDPATRADISEAVKSTLSSVFDIAEGNLVGLATQIALEYGVAAPVELLTAQITDEKAELDSRVASLNGLARQEPSALKPLWARLLKSSDPAFKAAVVSELLAAEPERGLTEAFAMSESPDVKTKQQGYRLLGPIQNAKVAALFSERLAKFSNEKKGAQLDLIENAAFQTDESVKKALAAYTASLDSSDILAAFAPTLHGGDVREGKEIFMTHAAGQCAKCHKVNGDGGVAGPELTGIGTRHDRAYLLESLVSPSAVVVPGYGLTMMTLKNGKTIGGTYLSEDEAHVTLKVADPDNSAQQIEKQIALADIETKQPPISAMPPMGLIMKKSEVRDLITYLSSLKEKNGKKGH
ncbi:HEAT repeat domain-containing protein [Verrucomicrobiales bacterium]|nr:HEAT repeat domain-containing protein [Verrucomicrobiales bacterium]MDB4358974.1 HEAT repeat domain-containing protein [Verrucomicrobiales bacterium]